MDGRPMGVAMNQARQVFLAHELVDGRLRDIHEVVGSPGVMLLAGLACRRRHRVAFRRWPGQELPLPVRIANLRAKGLVGLVFRAKGISVQESHRGAVALDACGFLKRGPAGTAGQRMTHEKIPVARHEVQPMVISSQAGQAVEQRIEERVRGVVTDPGLKQVS